MLPIPISYDELPELLFCIYLYSFKLCSLLWHFWQRLAATAEGHMQPPGLDDSPKRM